MASGASTAYAMNKEERKNHEKLQTTIKHRCGRKTSPCPTNPQRKNTRTHVDKIPLCETYNSVPPCGGPSADLCEPMGATCAAPFQRHHGFTGQVHSPQP